MNFIKNYNYFIGAYIVVFLYIIFGGNQALSAVLVTVLFLLNIYEFTVVKETYYKENEDSVSTLALYSAITIYLLLLVC